MADEVKEALAPEVVVEKAPHHDAAIGTFAAYLAKNHYQPLAIEERIVIQIFIDWCIRTGYRGWL